MTKEIGRTLMALALAVLVVAYLPLSTVSGETENPKYETAQGELLRVNTDARTFVIKTDDGAEMEFMYNSETEISGAQEGVAGLATQSGNHVTVHFQDEEEGRLATRIEIESSS